MKRLIIIILLIFYLQLAITQRSLSPSENTGIKILVDNSPPIIEIISPKNITYNNATSLLINFTIIEHSLDSIWYSLNHEENITIISPFYVNLSEGNYVLTIYANDSRNRINSSEVYFSINNSISACGDNTCNTNENCNLCPQDCGTCPTTNGNSRGSSGGGGGSGGGEIPAIEKTKENKEDKTPAIDNNLSFEEKTPEKKITENEQRINVNYKIILLFLIPLLIIISLIILYKFINQKVFLALPRLKRRGLFKTFGCPRFSTH